MNSRRFRSIRYGILCLAFAAGAARAAPAAIDGGDRTYENCTRLAHTNPDAALEAALSWQDMGGGGAARHCAAVALFDLGQFSQAAKRFEALAESLKAAPANARAAMLAQAGASWFRAGDIKRAYAVQTSALKLDPGNPDYLMDRATTLAAAKNYWEAIDDLDTVIEADPKRVEALILRASAYRFVDAMPLAREDAERAHKLSPDRPEVLLEYGIEQRLAGDRDGARKSWLRLLRLHDGTPAADAARRNLELLDVKVER